MAAAKPSGQSARDRSEIDEWNVIGIRFSELAEED
jgi:hypothetical protein